jgi:hypothetical protein
MDQTVRTAIAGVHAVTRAQRIGAASRYITDTNFLNLLQNIDINKPANFNYSLFATFNSVPGLRDQVKIWLQNT